MMARYVAFEGVDGAGKTTVATAVVEKLAVELPDLVFVREPGGTATGEQIRRVLLAEPGRRVNGWTEAMLFAAARAQLAAEVVGPALEAGRAVVTDRSVYSSLAYQGGGRGLGVDAVRQVNEVGLMGVWPETVVLLRVDPATALRREDMADRISIEGVRLQERVAATYDLLADDEPERFVVVDAGLPFDEVVSLSLTEVLSRW